MSDSRARVWFSLFVLAVFCVGLAVGLVLGRRMDAPRGDGGMFVGPPGARGGPAGRGRGILIERLARELELSPEQKTRVRAILDARRPRVEAFQRDIAARAEQEQRDLQTEVRGVLTPEQQQRFDRWVERQPRGRRGRPPM
jgi:Spy/CpxP family protein refolding chaperone